MFFTINRNQSQDQDEVFKAIWGKKKLIEQKICIIINKGLFMVEGALSLSS